MRRRSALVAGLVSLLATRARADDPRDLFGLDRRTVEPPPGCDDGRAFGCAGATDPFDDVSPYALRTWLPSTYLLSLPVAGARHDAVAHFALGASRDEAGPFFAGATGLENRWTIDGAPADGLRTGSAETRVPLVFLEGMLVQAGGFAARDRASTGGIIDAQLKTGTAGHAVETHAWLGHAPLDARARPVAAASYTLRRLAIDAGTDANLSAVATGPLPRFLGGRAWYAVGLAPALQLSEYRWRAASLVDVDGDGIPDGFPGIIATETIERTTATATDFLVPAMMRAGWQRGAHALDLTLVGHVGRDTVYFANATQSSGIDRLSVIGDAIATWRGTWRDTRVRGQLAWHRSTRDENPHESGAINRAQWQTAYVPAQLPEDPVLAEACDDTRPSDPYPMVPNCPIPAGFFLSGGPGLLVDTTGDRPSATLDAAHRHGRHVVRAGGTFEDSRLVTASSFSGGGLVRSLFDGHTDTQRFYSGTCPEDATMPCNYIAEAELNYRSRYTAAYLEDTFEPASRIRVNAGLRWELMWVGTRLHFSNQLAPRLGLAWDLTDDGRTRLWTSLGRTHIMIPPGMGDTVIGRNRTVRDVHTDLGDSRRTDSGLTYAVAPGIRAPAQDEATLGFEGAIARAVELTIWVQGRTLRRGLENILFDPDTGEARFDNPGRDGRTPATRHSFVVATELSTDPRASTVVRAGYLYGRTVGSWTGPFDPRQGAQLYAGIDWDLDATNLYGFLPTDPGHRAFVEGQRHGKLGGFQVGAATRVTVSSGRPRSVLGDTDLGILQLLPRGSAGRAPMVTQVNARLAARWRDIDILLDVFNVFDRETATNLNEVYAGEAVRPIAGGTEEDLVFLKESDSSSLPASRRTAYRLPTVFQSPLSVALGLRKTF